MKSLRGAGLTRMLGRVGQVGILVAAMVSASGVQAAPVEIQVWHTLTDGSKTELEKLAKQYNAEQNNVRVELRNFADTETLEHEISAAAKTGKVPHLVELGDDHSPTIVAERKIVLPLYELLAKYPIKDLNWFLPATESFVRDTKGRLLAFPWMAEVPIMFYNINYYKKAGLDASKPARTWTDLQADLLKLRDVANVSCPYASSDQVTVHLENLAPINNQRFVSNDNGLNAAKMPPAMQFDTLYMRHVSLMVSWKRSLLFTAHANDNTTDQLFAKGECAVLTSGSGSLSRFLNTPSLSFGVAPLPYYAQATKQPGPPFVSGSALWALKGHTSSEEKATATFLAWLAKPVIAAEWHQHTGYLPLTEAAFRASDVSFYDRIPGLQQVVTALRSQPTATSRGFRMANYPRIEFVLNQELNDAFQGKVPPVAALNNAANFARNLAHPR